MKHIVIHPELMAPLRSLPHQHLAQVRPTHLGISPRAGDKVRRKATPGLGYGSLERAKFPLDRPPHSAIFSRWT